MRRPAITVGLFLCLFESPHIPYFREESNITRTYNFITKFQVRNANKD